jgi:hypothetical protein
MDGFAIALLVFAVVFLGGVLCIGLATLLQIRSGRRERLEMKKHLQRIERVDWYAVPRRT